MHKLAGPEHPFVDPALLKAKHDEASAAADKHYQETERLEAPRIEKEMLTAMAAEIDEMCVLAVPARSRLLLLKINTLLHLFL